MIDLIKTVNRLKLGQLLCRCRSPDFLLDIIRRQVQYIHVLLSYTFTCVYNNCSWLHMYIYVYVVTYCM